MVDKHFIDGTQNKIYLVTITQYDSNKISRGVSKSYSANILVLQNALRSFLKKQTPISYFVLFLEFSFMKLERRALVSHTQNYSHTLSFINLCEHTY